MRSRRERLFAGVGTLATFVLALGCLVLGLNDVSTAGRVAFGALALVDLVAATALSFLIWPRRP